MDGLSEELQERGLLDATTAGWAAARAAEGGGAFDTALLELDLVDEEELLDALQACTGLPAASLHHLEPPHPEIGARLPEGFSRTFRMCPWTLDGSLLVALVEAPLPEDWLAELRDLFGLEVDQRVAPAHCVDLARERVYGAAAAERSTALEARLAGRRSADVRAAVEHVSGASDLRSAVAALLAFGEGLLAHATFVVVLDEELYVAAGRGYRPETKLLSMPAAGATLRAALRHRGFFAGPVAGTEQDRRFWESLGVEVPRAAVVVPVPTREDDAVVFLADNGPRGIPTRRVAELTLLVSRLGAHGGEWSALGGGPQPVTDPGEPPAPEPELPEPEPEPSAPEPGPPEPSDPPRVVLRDDEQAALQRLRQVAAAEGVAVDALVDSLLAAREAPRPSEEEPSLALAGEVRGLFEKLAQDIPAQLARGMETAFRDMVPRIATQAAPGAPEPPRRSAAASVEIVQKEPAKREVPSYRSRRARAKRVKL